MQECRGLKVRTGFWGALHHNFNYNQEPPNGSPNGSGKYLVPYSNTKAFEVGMGFLGMLHQGYGRRPDKQNKAPCSQIVYTYTLKYQHRKPFKA